MESKEEARICDVLRTRMARILYKNDTIQNETLFHMLTTTIFEHRHVRTGTAKQWTFPGAFYFSTLVVTLIGKFNFETRIDSLELSFLGYGHTTPKTSTFEFESVYENVNESLFFSWWKDFLYGLYSSWRVNTFRNERKTESIEDVAFL